MGTVRTTWKTYQFERNIIDATCAMERLLTSRVQTVGLLQLILPIGWRLSKTEDKVKYVERDLEIKPQDINNVYLSLRNNKVHILNYFECLTNTDMLTIRLNVVVDEYERIKLI